MAQVRFYAAVSADGFIADLNGSTDWLAGFDPARYGFEEFFAAIGSVVVGRRTYDFQRAFDDWPYGSKPVYVLTSKMLANPPPYVTASRDGLAAALAAARARSPGDIWIVGGAVAMRTALAEGLVDLVELFSVPILLGSGLPMFGALERHVPLTLVGLEAFPDGVVKLAYAPQR
jgi:dihydrofolate reductase